MNSYAILGTDLRTVVNVIVAPQAFINEYYPQAIRIDEIHPAPGIGWTYTAGEFSPTNG